jgi:hypothetical protein
MGGLFQNGTLTTTPQAFYNTIPDVDAQAFITAASITNGIQKIAIYRLVTDLKGYGVWTKMKAIYPVVGGTAASHAVNLKTPGTYNLSFTAGWTHSSTGMLPNGSAYADTNLSPSAILTLYNTHLSYYSRTNLLETTNIEMGSYTGTGNNLFALNFGRSPSNANSVQYDQGTASNLATSTTQTDSQGFWLGNRTSNLGSTHKLFRNGVSIASASTTGGSLLSNNIILAGIYNGGTYSNFSSKQCAFASIGDGLTDTEAANYYIAVQRYQITLNRQV